MRPSATSISSPLVTSATGGQPENVDLKTPAKRAKQPDAPAPGAELARFATEERAIGAGATARHPSTVTESLKAAAVTVDAVSLCEMAQHNISGGRLTARVPLRRGTVALEIGKGEPLKLGVPRGVTATVSAVVKPTPRGLLLSEVSIDFNGKHLEVLNPGLFVGSGLGGGLLGGLLGGVVNTALKLQVTRLSIDEDGQLQPHGIPIPTALLPRYDLHLNKFVGSGRPSSLPKLPSTDPRQLISALGGLIEKAEFTLELNGPSETIKVASDGAEIQSPAGRGTLKVTGELARDASGALTGKTSGKLEAAVGATISLKPGENAIASNGIKIAYRDERLVLDAGDLHIARAIAGQLSVFVGDSLSLDAKTSADISSELKIVFAKDGSLAVTANNVEATLGLNDAAAVSPRITLALGNPSTASFKLAQLGVGTSGIIARGPDGSVNIKVDGGQLDLSGSKLVVKPGKIVLNAKAESVDSGGTASLVLDLPLEAQVSWPPQST